jgi:multiple sugar transport system ATP-binding protein
VAGVRLCHVNKIYEGGFQAVHDANLQIADGEFVVLVGPSGCGKSTTLRMIAGLEEISSGEIYIGDRLVNKVEPGNRDIAMVFQNYALYPHMSVRQNMAFGLRMRKVARAEIDKRVQNAAEILSIEPLLDRRPREMSGGQRQRVALGRAIVREPQVFLFDEPLSNLDAKLRVQMRTEIARLHHRLKTTMIYVTHDQVEAMTLGDRIVIMNDGVIQQVDTPMQLYRQPANRFVAGFIGSPTMNFFDGKVRDGQFVDADRSIPVGSDVQDGQVILGVRPEDFLIDNTDGCFADVSLDVVEHMGHETMVYFELNGSSHVARLPADADVSSGDRLRLAIRSDAWHLFSAADRQVRIK